MCYNIYIFIMYDYFSKSAYNRPRKSIAHFQDANIRESIIRTVGSMNDFIVTVQSVPLGGVYEIYPLSPAHYATLINGYYKITSNQKKSIDRRGLRTRFGFCGCFTRQPVCDPNKSDGATLGESARALFTKLRAERLMRGEMQVTAKFEQLHTWVSYLSSVVSPCLLITFSMDAKSTVCPAGKHDGKKQQTLRIIAVSHWPETHASCTAIMMSIAADTRSTIRALIKNKKQISGRKYINPHSSSAKSPRNGVPCSFPDLFWSEPDRGKKTTLQWLAHHLVRKWETGAELAAHNPRLWSCCHAAVSQATRSL